VLKLPSLLQQLRPEELSQAAEFATSEGMREPVMQVLEQPPVLQVALLQGCVWHFELQAAQPGSIWLNLAQ